MWKINGKKNNKNFVKYSTYNSCANGESGSIYIRFNAFD